MFQSSVAMHEAAVSPVLIACDNHVFQSAVAMHAAAVPLAWNKLEFQNPVYICTAP